MIEPVTIELWAPEESGEYLPSLVLIDPVIQAWQDHIDTSILAPMKRNPERTRWRVILAIVQLKKPPPRWIPDKEREGKRTFAAGLRTIELKTAVKPLNGAAGERAHVAIERGSPLRFMVDGEFMATVYVTWVTHTIPSEDGMFSIEAQVIPKQEEDARQ